MTKLKKFSNEFDAIYSEKTIHRLGEYGVSQAVEHSSEGFREKVSFVEC